MSNPTELPFVRVLTEAFRLGAQATEFTGSVGVERRISKLETKLGKFSFAVVQPWLFEAIRSIFGVNERDFAASLRAPLVERDNGAGKSGASFFSTQDNKFVLKVVKEDAATVSEISTRFLSHFQANPGTFIAPFYALIVLKLKHKNASKSPIVLICMPNSFCKTQAKDFMTAPPGRRRAANGFRRYDLKGLMDGRIARCEEGSSTETTVYQDHDVVAHRQHIWTSSAMKATIRAQLSADCRFLEECAVIDYSLLLGVVKTQFVDSGEEPETSRPRNVVGPWETPRKNHALDSSLDEDDRHEPSYENDRRRTPTGVRVIEGVYLPKQSRFQPVGEIPSSNTELARANSQAEEESKIPELKEVYLLSIVDTFQTFNSLKAAESKIKNLYKNATIQSPQEYSQRFRTFMDQELVRVDVQQEQISLTRSAAIAIKGAKLTSTVSNIPPLSLPHVPVLGWAHEKPPEFRSIVPASPVALPIHTPTSSSPAFSSVPPPMVPPRPLLTATPPFSSSPLNAMTVPLLGLAASPLISSVSSANLLEQKEDIDSILRVAIQQGGALYTSGQINESCERYIHAARAVLLQTLPPLQKQLWAAMELSPGDQQAWTFRRTFDLILFHEGLRDHDRSDG